MQAFGLARLGRDAELRTTGNGEQVANLSLAFTFGRKGTDGKRPTQWVEASLWGPQAAALAPYLLRGSSISVTLRDVCTETFNRADGSPGFKMVGTVLHVDLAERAPAPQDHAPAPAAQPARRPPAPAPAPRAPAPPPRSNTGSGFDDMDDDIPFMDPMKSRAFCLAT